MNDKEDRVSEEMIWKKYAEGTDEALFKPSRTDDALRQRIAEMNHASFVSSLDVPQFVPVYATLIDSDMERIRAIVREELRQDWQEPIPFGEEVDEEEERKWRETERENARRHLEEIREIVRKEVRQALREDDEDRVEPNIVTLQPITDARGLYRQCARCYQLREITISRRNPEIAAVLDALSPFLRRCTCKE